MQNPPLKKGPATHNAWSANGRYLLEVKPPKPNKPLLGEIVVKGVGDKREKQIATIPDAAVGSLVLGTEQALAISDNGMTVVSGYVPLRNLKDVHVYEKDARDFKLKQILSEPEEDIDVIFGQMASFENNKTLIIAAEKLTETPEGLKREQRNYVYHLEENVWVFKNAHIPVLQAKK